MPISPQHVTQIDGIYSPPINPEAFGGGSMTSDPKCFACGAKKLTWEQSCIICESIKAEREKNLKQNLEDNPVHKAIVAELFEELEVLREALAEAEGDIIKLESRNSELISRLELLREIYKMKPKPVQKELPLVAR